MEMHKLAEKIRLDLSNMYSMLRFVVKIDESCVWVMDNPDGSFQSPDPRNYCVPTLDDWLGLKSRLEQEDRDFNKKWHELMQQTQALILRWVDEGLTEDQAREYFWHGRGLTKKELDTWKTRKEIKQQSFI